MRALRILVIPALIFSAACSAGDGGGDPGAIRPALETNTKSALEELKRGRTSLGTNNLNDSLDDSVDSLMTQVEGVIDLSDQASRGGSPIDDVEATELDASTAVYGRWLPAREVLAKDILTGSAVDATGRLEEAFLPAPSWDKTMTDINTLRLKTWHSTETLLVSALYDSGRLGPKEQVFAGMEEIAAANTLIDEATGKGTVPRFFNPPPPEGDGGIIAYGKLNEHQKGALKAWIESSHVQASPAASEVLSKARLAFEGRQDDMDTR